MRKRRVEKGRKHLLTIREIELLEALKRSGSVKYAAEDLKISYRRAVNILANIRNKWEKAVNTHNKLVAMCRRNEALRRLLSKPGPRRLPAEKMEEQEKL